MKFQENIYIKASALTIVAFVIAIVVCAVISLCACSRKVVYVPQETTTVKSDTVTRYVDRAVTDTIRVQTEVYDTRYDSIAPILDSLNRVVGYDRWHYREVSKFSESERRSLLSVIDSLRTVKADSVQVTVPFPVEVVKEVERKLLWWQKILIWLGAISSVFALLYVAKRIRDFGISRRI